MSDDALLYFRVVLPTFGVLVLGMLLMLELGWRVGTWRMMKDPEGAKAGGGALEAAVLALLGLLISFTFFGAATRFDQRRQLIVEEGNAIERAYLRLNLLPAGAQPAMRELFRQYLDARLDVYQIGSHVQATTTQQARSAALQEEIWNRAVTITREQNNSSTTILLLPAINDMIDIATTRTWATQLHPPWAIFAMLGVLMLVSALFAGYGMAGGKTRSWLHIVGFATALALTVYVTADFELPRGGLIHLGTFDQMLVDVRQSMK